MDLVSFKRLKKSFYCAFRGLKIAVLEGQVFRIHAVLISSVIIILLIVFPLTTSEKAVVVLTIFFVLILELINTVFERVIDVFDSKINHQVRIIKDMMAGVVLLGSIGAAIIAFLVFGPTLMGLLMVGTIIIGFLLARLLPRTFG